MRSMYLMQISGVEHPVGFDHPSVKGGWRHCLFEDDHLNQTSRRHQSRMSALFRALAHRVCARTGVDVLGDRADRASPLRSAL